MNHSSEITGLRVTEHLKEELRGNTSLLRAGTSFLAGFAIAMGRITGETAPFGVSVVAAMPRAGAFPALLGVSLGYLAAAPAPLSWRYVLASAGTLLLRWLFSWLPFGKKSGHRVAAASVAVVAAVILPELYQDPLIYDILIWLTSLMMAGAGAAFLGRAARFLWMDEAGKRAALREGTVILSLALTAALALMGLCTLTLGGLSLGRVLASVLLLLTAAAFGSRGAALLGVVAGMVVGFSTGEFTLSITCFAVGGLLAGIFFPLGRIGSVLALTICYGFCSMLAQRSAAGFLEVLLAAILFLLLPASLARRMGQLAPLRGGEQIGRLLAERRLSEASTALREVASTTEEVAKRISGAYAEDLSAVYDRVAARCCRGCVYQLSCWEEHYGDTMDAFGHAVQRLRRTGSLTASELGPQLGRCMRREEIAGCLREEWSRYASREQERRHAARVRDIVTDQFEGLAGALEGISSGLGTVLPCGENLTERLLEALQKEEKQVREVLAWRGLAGRLTVRVELPISLEKWLQPEKLTEVLSAAAGLPMAAGKKTREGSSLYLEFYERPLYRLEQGSCQLIAEDGEVSGDTLRLVRCAEGVSAMVLSDGMGCGQAAALDSTLLATLISRLLEAGIPCQSALRLVNSALMVKGGRESLATLDATEVDCYTGRASFHKAGAAPTILLHRGRAVEVDTVSLPAGILGGVEPSRRELTLEEQDLIVMVSDGVPTEEPWIGALLEEWEGKDLSALCRQIAESARLRWREPKEDDITVAALRLVKNR